MHAFKGLIPAALTLSFLGLSACGSVDHDPPEIKSTFGTVSPMDTLVVEFDKSLDDFDDSLVSSNVPFTVVKQKGSKVYIVGASDTVADIPRFEPASNYDTLKFTGVKDSDGNKEKDTQAVTFSTYPFLDSDEYELDKKGNCFSNEKPKDAEVLTDSTAKKFFNGASTSKGLTVTGILAGQFNPDCEDDVESYRIFLKKRDTISVALEGLSSAIPLQLAVRGPSKMKNAPDFCNVDNEEFLTVDAGENKGAAIDTTFGIGDIHECGTNTVTDYLAYYIQVRFSDKLTTKEQLPQAYKLTVTVHH